MHCNRTKISPFLVIGLIFLFFTNLLQAQDYNPSTVQFVVQQQMEQEPAAFYEVYFLLEDQVNYKQVEASFRQNRTNISNRTVKTVQLLQAKAAATQGALLDYLQASPKVRPSSIRSYWVANAIFAEVQAEVIETLSHDPQIAWIGHNNRHLLISETTDDATLAPVLLEPNSTEPGLLAVNAPALWAKGYTGYGTTVFMNDTGVFPDHPAYHARFSGHYPDAFSDFYHYEYEGIRPFDCSDHGTHVLGTTIGLDRQTHDTIGVAFNAHWIGAAILCGEGTADNIGAFQWSLDRDGDPTTVDDVPDVINNSWYDDEMTDSDCQSIYVPVLEAMELAGIAVVFSAGNEGPEPMTITPPHNINVDTVNSFTVAATAITAPYLVANFSSRGPSRCGGEGSILIKPEVAAPGVQVRSSVPGGYGLKSGTSMAAPHTSGIILLLKEAFPYLTGRELKLAIYHTCTDLGDTGEDNVYGMGMINGLAAFDYLVAQGHEPIQPIRTNDVLLVDAIINRVECEGELNPYVVFENAGMDTLYNVEIAYSTDLGATAVFNWEGVLVPNALETLHLPALIAPEGQQKLTLVLQNPNGQTDLRSLNNQMILPVLVSQKEAINAYVETTSFCEGSQAVLKSGYQGEGQVQWYDSRTGGSLLSVGNFYETENLDTFTRYYADILYKDQVGIEDKEVGTGTVGTEEGAGLIFNCENPFTLKSVTIYAESVGGREISLFDWRGEKINSKVLWIVPVGENVIDLNFPIEVGQNYELALTDGNPLFSTTAELAYPYEAPEIVTITGAVRDSIPSDQYFYFYDWQIEYQDICGRTQVDVDVLAGEDVPIAAFDLSADTVMIEAGAMISLTNTAENAVEYLWDFGDGTTSTAMNPTHMYQTAGVYFVSQTVWSADACADATALPIVVTDLTDVATSELSTEGDFVVYPNPTQDRIRITLQENKHAYKDLLLYNTQGVLLETKALEASTSTIDMTLGAFPAGVYYIVLKSDNGRALEKVLKQ